MTLFSAVIMILAFFMFCLTHNALAPALTRRAKQRIDDFPRNDMHLALVGLKTISDQFLQKEPKYLAIESWQDDRPPIYLRPGSDIFYNHKIIHITALYLLDYYIRTKITSPEYASYQNITTFHTNIILIINTLNSDMLNNITSITYREMLFDSLFMINHQKWFNSNKKFMNEMRNTFIYKCKIVHQVKELGMSLERAVGKGSYGTVYLLRNRLDHTNFALKYFDDDEDCFVEEKIMKQLKLYAVNASIAHLQMNDEINCSMHSCFVMDFVDGQPVGQISEETVKEHPHGFLGFVHDFGVTVDSVLTMMESVPLGLVHGDLTGQNVLYEADSQRFVVIDFGGSILVRDNGSFSRFIGSFQNIGPFGWKLHQRVDQRLIFTESDMERNWKLGHQNDIYAMRANQIEILGLYSTMLEEMEVPTEIIEGLNQLLSWSWRYAHQMLTLQRRFTKNVAINCTLFSQ